MTPSEAAAAGFVPVLPPIRPILVQFYRCGRAQRDRGWVKCSTPQECLWYGCRKASERSGLASAARPLDEPDPLAPPIIGDHAPSTTDSLGPEA